MSCFRSGDAENQIQRTMKSCLSARLADDKVAWRCIHLLYF